MNSSLNTAVDLGAPEQAAPSLARWDVSILTPPYAEPRPILAVADARTPACAPVAVVRLGNGLRTRQTMREVAARLPTIPRVLLVTRETTPATLRLAFDHGRLDAECVLEDGEPLFIALRRALTDASGFTPTVSRWLRANLACVPLSLRQALAHLIGSYDPAEGFAAAVERLRVTPLALRRRLAVQRLPSPVQWWCLARALHVAMLVQRDAARSLAALAYDVGFEEQASMNALVRRTFGLRPSELRGTLGVAWLMDRWAAPRLPRRQLFPIDLRQLVVRNEIE